MLIWGNCFITQMHTVNWIPVALKEICDIDGYVSDRPVVIMFPAKLAFYLLISMDIYCRSVQLKILMLNKVSILYRLSLLNFSNMGISCQTLRCSDFFFLQRGVDIVFCHSF